MPGFNWKIVGDLKYLELTAFSSCGGIKAYFSSRLGGVSRKPFDSLNLGLHNGDDPEAVLENRRRLSVALGIDWGSWVAGEQVHGNGVAVVAEQERGCGAGEISTAISRTDALVTATRKLPLVSFYADCVPLYFYDPEHGVAALAHAGWKGTVLKIALHTLEKMQQEFGTRPWECLAAIGPSIRRCCYQVDRVVADGVTKEFPKASGILEPDGPQHWKLDLQHLNFLMLVEAGLDPVNISDSKFCTCCRIDDFFSYRSAGTTGRMTSVIQLI